LAEGNVSVGASKPRVVSATTVGSAPFDSAGIGYASLAARICLSAVYLYSGIIKLVDIPAGMAEVAGLGLPAPGVFLALTILVQLGGGLMVLVGLWTRLAAFLLLGFTVVATALAHNPFGMDGIEFQRQVTTSLEHLAIVGGFILLIAGGVGPISIDGWMARRLGAPADAMTQRKPTAEAAL
jgi:putative oxidoreductase